MPGVRAAAQAPTLLKHQTDGRRAQVKALSSFWHSHEFFLPWNITWNSRISIGLRSSSNGWVGRRIDVGSRHHTDSNSMVRLPLSGWLALSSDRFVPNTVVVRWFWFLRFDCHFSRFIFELNTVVRERLCNLHSSGLLQALAVLLQYMWFRSSGIPRVF